ncbi:response regulator [Pontibacter sp. G13]|uniref:hybrid sensor histidine kinase/response regulator transcription factor n=1 Tax=Pontibacter sp. G13 TaxID=3074898 RepID=UPI00288B656D|nr:response regulator [Pontibacter sp. G13]WNJ18717.1 response regulator [Pontibacter sp. G13]
MQTFCSWIGFGWLVLMAIPSLQAQTPNLPLRPFSRHFPLSEMGGHSIITSIAFRPDGTAFVADTDGFLQFDGTQWNHFPGPRKNQTIRALAYLGDTLFAGTDNDFGYFQWNDHGEPHFISLQDQLPDSCCSDFGSVWDIVEADGAIWFRSYRYLMRWDGQEIQYWKPGIFFTGLFEAAGQIYVRDWQSGLKRLSGEGQLELVPGGDRFAMAGLSNVLDIGAGKRMLISRDQGLFMLEENEMIPFPTDQDELLKSRAVHDGVMLPNGDLALAVEGAGVLIFDQAGRCSQVWDKSLGMPMSMPFRLYLNPQGSLWVHLNNGVAIFEVDDPFWIWHADYGMEWDVLDVFLEGEEILISTQVGIFRVDRSSTSLPESPMGDERELVLNIERVGDEVLAATQSGIAKLSEGTLTFLAPLQGSRLVRKDPWRENGYWASSFHGFQRLERNDDGFQLDQAPLINGRINEFLLLNDSTQFVNTQSGYWIKLADGRLDTLAFRYQGSKRQDMVFVPALVNRSPARDHAFDWLDHRGGWKWNVAADSVELVVPIAPNSPKLDGIIETRLDDQGGLWAMIWSDSLETYQLASGKMVDQMWQWTWVISLDRLEGLGDLGGIRLFQQELWIFGRRGVAVMSIPAARQDTPNMSVAFGKITSGTDTWFSLRMKDTLIPLNQPHAPISVHASLTGVPVSAKAAFRWAWDDPTDWSEWGQSSFKEWNHLPAGRHTLYLQASSIGGMVSEAASQEFFIPYPWYAQWWAWGIYLLGLVGLIGLIRKVSILHVERRKDYLEALLADRTQDLIAKTHKLEEMDRTKNQFFANISHELRTPITLISGPAEKLAQEDLTQDASIQVERIQSNASLMADLVDQLMDLSRLDEGMLTVKPKQGNIWEQVSRFSAAFDSWAERRQIHFSVKAEDVQTTEWITSFDPDHLQKVVNNLLSNAFKFTPAGGRIDVHLSRQGNTFVLSVADSGPGIPSEHAPFIFDRFYQIHRHQSSGSGGAGIGLSLSQELMRLTGGSLKLVPSEKGAKFEAEFPFAAVRVENHPPSPEMVPAKHLDDSPRFEILVAEDHHDLRAFLKESLSGNFEVHAVENGKEAMDWAILHVPDLIVSDVMMPEMDGFTLLESLRKDGRTDHIPVLMLTALADQAHRQKGWKLGADEYLKKPFSTEELIVRVNSIIEMRQTLQLKFQQRIFGGKGREEAQPSLSDSFAQKLDEVIRAHLEEETFGVEQLSESLHLSRRQLLRKVKALTGMTPTEYIRKARLVQAHQLLVSGSGTVSEVAFQTGFSSLSYFTTSFRETFGILPSELSGKAK